MGKRLFSLILVLFVALTSVFAISCGKKECEHEYEYIVIKQASCGEKGKLEGICTECGDKIYKDLAKLDHDYSNGVCVNCGLPEREEIADGEVLGWTLDDVFEKAQDWGIEVEDKEQFVSMIYEQGNISTSLNSLDMLIVDYCYHNNGYFSDYVYSSQVLCPVRKIDTTINVGKIDKLFGINVQDDVLNVIYVDGTIEPVGALIEKDGVSLIKSFFINKQNQFIVIFADNSARRFGTLKIETDQAVNNMLLYSPIYNNAYGTRSVEAYEVVGVIDDKATEIVVPPTHKGKPVTSIGGFRGLENLTKVTIGENVTTIREEAFLHCKNLTEIVMNFNLESIGKSAFNSCVSLTDVTIGANVKYLGIGAFANCSNLSTVRLGTEIEEIGGLCFYGAQLSQVFYAGSASDFQKVHVARTNQELINATWNYIAS